MSLDDLHTSLYSIQHPNRQAQSILLFLVCYQWNENESLLLLNVVINIQRNNFYRYIRNVICMCVFQYNECECVRMDLRAFHIYFFFSLIFLSSKKQNHRIRTYTETITKRKNNITFAWYRH